MKPNYEKFEGYIKSDGNPHWNQSYYYNAYDPVTRVGILIRVGIQESRQDTNTWFIVFQDGLPIFTRTNMNLPYSAGRPREGLEIAGMRIHAEIPLKKTRISLSADGFSADFTWDELHPMEDNVAMTKDTEGSFARELSHVHLEGTSTITGHFVHRGVRTDVNAKGFRDIAAGPRNWDALLHYRLAWPVFENGTAFAGVHGISTEKQSAYMRMYHDGTQWRRVTHIDDQMVFASNQTSVESAHWTFTDDLGRTFEMSGKPLFTWLFPLDTFVLCEQMMEFRLGDGTIGYGLYETGYRLPWRGIE
ncbi:hypothetical protein BG58_27870 [Caballeronia jiangsuensis]|nr:hypothetical protein BG58_27870 [Caballeronia jiangsuensis]